MAMSLFINGKNNIYLSITFFNLISIFAFIIHE